MYIFIASIIVVSIIGLCFFKKSFWENRYLLLMIICGVALVATTTTNYIVRGKYEIIPKTINEREITQFRVPDSLLTDGIAFQTDEEFSFTSDFNEDTDSTTIENPKSTIFFYDMHLKKDYWKVGFVKSNGNETYKYWINVYILESPVDDRGYLKKIILVHDFSTAPKWVSKYGVPRRETIECLYIPKAEYAMIPDSLIRELPIKM